MAINLSQEEFKQIFREQEEQEEKANQKLAQARLKLAQDRLKLAQDREQRKARQEKLKELEKQEQKTVKNNDNLFYFTIAFQFISIISTFLFFIYLLR